jgi:hypothetical protein
LPTAGCGPDRRENQLCSARTSTSALHDRSHCQPVARYAPPASAPATVSRCVSLLQLSQRPRPDWPAVNVRTAVDRPRKYTAADSSSCRNSPERIALADDRKAGYRSHPDPAPLQSARLCGTRCTDRSAVGPQPQPNSRPCDNGRCGQSTPTGSTCSYLLAARPIPACLLTIPSRGSLRSCS